MAALAGDVRHRSRRSTSSTWSPISSPRRIPVSNRSSRIAVSRRSVSLGPRPSSAACGSRRSRRPAPASPGTRGGLHPLHRRAVDLLLVERPLPELLERPELDRQRRGLDLRRAARRCTTRRARVGRSGAGRHPLRLEVPDQGIERGEVDSASSSRPWSRRGGARTSRVDCCSASGAYVEVSRCHSALTVSRSVQRRANM